MKLLIDMNLSPRWVDWFSNSGIKAVHWSTVGKSNALDSEIMKFAASNDYIVLTHDLDFSAILAASHDDRPSVIQIRAGDVSPEAIGKQIVASLHQMESELLAGALLTIDPSHTRLRLLPFQEKD